MSICNYCQPLTVPNCEVSGAKHHDSLVALNDSAASCKMCESFVASMKSDASKYDDLIRSASLPGGYSKLFLWTSEQPDRSWSLQVVTPTCDRQFPVHVRDHGGHPHTTRAIWSSESSVTFRQSVPVLQNWMSECGKTHPQCQAASRGRTGQVPKRLIQIDSSDWTKIHLVESSTRPWSRTRSLEDYDYAALSYCWGVSGGLCTTKGNLSKHLGSIPFADLPLTLQNSVEVAYALGFRYLWADRLCIIQDDDQDWQHEAADMINVYQNTSLTIAATCASSADEGILAPRPAATHIEGLRIRIRTYQPLLRSPLFSRGWTLQEALLSPRTIHFAQDQLYWSCRECFTSEDGIQDDVQRGVRHLRRGIYDSDLSAERTPIKLESDKASNHQLWWDVVEQYSARVLTKQSDKLAAFAGLTRLFEKVLDSRPIAGSWADDFFFGLLWFNQQPTPRPRISDIPSWSWASVDGPISGPLQRHMRWTGGTAGPQNTAPSERESLFRQEAIVPLGQEPLFRQQAILSREPAFEWMGGEVSSPLSGGGLTLQARVAVGFWTEGGNRSFSHPSIHPQIKHEPHGHLPGQDSHIFFDSTPFPHGIIWMVQISSTIGMYGSSSGWDYKDFLVVEPVDCGLKPRPFKYDKRNVTELRPGPHTFRRIGVGMVHVSREDPFQEAEMWDIFVM